MTRKNNFDALRLIGAAMVIVGHAYHLLGRSAELPFVLGYPISTLGVVIFFSISGYLITISWTSRRDVVTYSSARVLRIMPALIVVVLVCAFVIGPLVTTYHAGRYFTEPLTWNYLSNIWMKPAYVLPGVWYELPYPAAVNGSLWTLPAEFFCYLLVPLVCVRSVALRTAMIAVLLAYAVYLSHIPSLESAVIYGNRISDAASMWIFFGVGALLATAETRWPAMFRTDVATLLFGGYVIGMSVLPQRTADIAFLLLPYVVLVIGKASTPVVRRAARFGDLSYGIYLWGFPVQQLVVFTIGVERMAIDLPLVLVVTTLAALASWHLVESPSLRLKTSLARRRQARQSKREVRQPTLVAP